MDWVVLTAGLVGLGLATMSVVSTGVEDLSNDTERTLNQSIVSGSLNWGDRPVESWADIDLAFYDEATAQAMYDSYYNGYSDFWTLHNGGVNAALFENNNGPLYSDRADIWELVAHDRGLAGADIMDYADQPTEWSTLTNIMEYSTRNEIGAGTANEVLSYRATTWSAVADYRGVDLSSAPGIIAGQSTSVINNEITSVDGFIASGIYDNTELNAYRDALIAERDSR